MALLDYEYETIRLYFLPRIQRKHYEIKAVLLRKTKIRYNARLAASFTQQNRISIKTVLFTTIEKRLCTKQSRFLLFQVRKSL